MSKSTAGAMYRWVIHLNKLPSALTLFISMYSPTSLSLDADYNIGVLKFKKGQTPDPGDSNELLNITVARVRGDMIGTLAFNRNKCQWTDACPKIDGTFHGSNAETILLGIDRNGTEVHASLMGDIAMTYSKAVDTFGQEAAETLKEDGFLFVPEEDSTNRAIVPDRSSDWHSHRYRDKIVIPYEINDAGVSQQRNNARIFENIPKAISVLEEATGVLKFVNTEEFAMILNDDDKADIPHHFIQFRLNEDESCFALGPGREPTLLQRIFKPCECIAPDSTKCNSCQLIGLGVVACQEIGTIMHGESMKRGALL